MPATTGPSKTVHFRDFSKGLNRTDARVSLKDNELWWSENVQPIGSGLLQILPPPGPPIGTIAAGIAKMFGVLMKIGGVEVTRLITVNQDGSMSAVDPTDGAITAIAPAGTVTTKARVTMWQDTPLLIGDPTKGYFTWDGTTLLAYPVGLSGTTTSASPTITGITPATTGLAVGMSVVSANLPVGTTIKSVDSSSQITVSQNATATGAVTLTVGAGAPTSVTDLSTFEGRTVLVSGSRALTFTAPASYTDFQTADGAVTVTITDAVFPGSIIRILSALEVLWVIGPGAVNAESNVQITASNVTSVANTNIVANVGTLLPSSVTSFFRTFLFLTPYGIYAIVGATPQKLSEKLDQLFPSLSFGVDQPAGIVALTRIFVWCVLVTYLDPATNTNRPILLCLSRNAWFVASQGALTWIASLINLSSGNPELWGTDGSTIYKCFGGSGAGSYTVQTKLYDFGEFTRRKQLVRLGVQTQNPRGLINLSITAENETGQVTPIALNAAPLLLTFTGAGGAPLTFTGAGGVPLTWITPSSIQVGAVNFSGDVLGLNLTGISQPFQLTGLAMELVPMGEWVV